MSKYEPNENSIFISQKAFREAFQRTISEFILFNWVNSFEELEEEILLFSEFELYIEDVLFGEKDNQ